MSEPWDLAEDADRASGEFPAAGPGRAAAPTGSQAMPAVRAASRRTSSAEVQAPLASSPRAPLKPRSWQEDAPTRSRPSRWLEAAPASGPRRYPSMAMEAVTPPSSGNLDDRLDFDIDVDLELESALELDGGPSSRDLEEEEPPPSSSSLAALCARPLGDARSPSSSQVRAVVYALNAESLRASDEASPTSSASRGGPSSERRGSGTLAAVDQHASIAAFAGFGDAPPGLGGAASYALHVARRRRALRAQLAVARLRRSADIGLYEAALRAADDDAVRRGFAVLAVTLAAIAGLSLASFYAASFYAAGG